LHGGCCWRHEVIALWTENKEENVAYSIHFYMSYERKKIDLPLDIFRIFVVKLAVLVLFLLLLLLLLLIIIVKIFLVLHRFFQNCMKF